MNQCLRMMLLAASLLVWCGAANAEMVGTDEAAASVGADHLGVGGSAPHEQ